MHRTVLSNIPGFRPLDANSIPQVQGLQTLPVFPG